MLKRIAVAALLVASVAGPMNAATLTYVLAGTVDSARLGVTSVGVGDTITLTFTVDTATPDLDSFASHGTYLSAVTSYSLSVGGSDFGSGSPGSVTVNDGPPGDQWTLAVTSTANLDGFPLRFANFSLTEDDGDVWTSDALAVPTDIAPFDVLNRIELRAPFDPNIGLVVLVVGHITSIQLVPEPSLAALFGAGVLALALRRRSSAI